MKFSHIVIIEKPRVEVVKYFSDPVYLKHYQNGFLRKELISGNLGELNSQSKIYYRQGKGEMELLETITLNNLPDTFEGHYYHTHMENTMKSTFISLSENQTQYKVDIHYTVFRGIIVNVMAFVAPGFFKKQVKKWLDNFKKFVESK